ncbi:unnamed protein product (macronuclear) [Paramecium tetraurelia]|uniref:Uncharacterized protein n=1 Tax=Paramecium tetraurelia TaxID=5888 RepID=A0DCQ6_PARTE|nr:uncharacterized protein GSPATT00039414001 [Paramecium tetraurelia]CAK80823.1 unnamed protein product [Paramecium tetraurelia]|eukprot:XP_001448220.1 hypothetical protein (macronuclear) [Paramecium tetraurelia strain d4-2]
MVIKIISCEVRQLDTAYIGGQILNCKLQQLISVYILIKSKGQCGSFFLTHRKSIGVNTNKKFIKCINLSLSIPAKLLLPIQIDQKTFQNIINFSCVEPFVHNTHLLLYSSIQKWHKQPFYSDITYDNQVFKLWSYNKHILSKALSHTENTIERILIIFMLGKAVKFNYITFEVPQKYIFNNQNVIDQLITGTQFENYNIARGKKFTARFIDILIQPLKAINTHTLFSNHMPALLATIINHKSINASFYNRQLFPENLINTRI